MPPRHEALRDIAIWIVQAVLFGIGIGFAGLTAHLAGRLLATEEWMQNPQL